MRLLNRSRRISHLIFRLRFQEYDRNLSIMLRAGAAIKDDVRLLLALHLRIMRERLNSNSSEASSLPRTQWPAQSACDVSAPNASSHSEISALQSMGWGDLGSLRV